MSAREFARWRQLHNEYPIDDESVHVVQVAALEARLFNLFVDAGDRAALPDFMLARRYRESINPTPEPEADPNLLEKKLIAALDRYAANHAQSE